MAKSRILVLDAQQKNVVRIGSDSSLLLSSTDAPWTNCFVEHQHLPPTETSEVYMQEHLLSIQLTPPSVLECKGDGRLQAMHLQPDDVFFSPAHVFNHCRWHEATEVVNLALPPAFVTQFALEAFDKDRVELISHCGGHDPQTAYIGRALKAEIEAGYPGGKLFGESLITALTTHLLTRYAASPPLISSPTGVLNRRAVHRIHDYIFSHLQSDLTLTELAHLVNLSPYYFTRLFKATTGTTPHQYVLRCRLEEARRLLETENFTLDGVAQRVGFVDRSHLIRHFHRTYGIPPRTLLRQQSRKIH